MIYSNNSYDKILTIHSGIIKIIISITNIALISSFGDTTMYRVYLRIVSWL